MPRLRLSKKYSVLFFGLCLLLAGCAGDRDTTRLKLAHGLPTSHPVHKAMEFLAERAAEKSQGRLRIDIYPSEQLGRERECLELLQIGSVAMTKVSTSVMEGFVPALSVFTFPFLFRDKEHLFRVLEGEVGRELLLAGQKYWLRGLCYYDAGSRSFYTKDKPILAPSDLAGMKIRTQESSTSMRMVQALGGSPTPISWGELYSALQQGVVDGAENNPPSFHLSRHYEVCRFYSLDEHTFVPDILLIGTRTWEDLTEEFRTVIQLAADESSQYEKKLWEEATSVALAAVREAGVQVFYPDRKPFVEKIDPVYETFRSNPEIWGLIQRIRGVN
jgi:tripartite ATP-independent transporter DctP family solute receptor